jgi:hypothetical protein
MEDCFTEDIGKNESLWNQIEPAVYDIKTANNNVTTALSECD